MLNNSNYLSTVDPASNGQAFVNLMRERTFTPELRNLVDKVTGVKNIPTADAGALKKLYKLFYRTENISRSSAQKLQDVNFPAYKDSFSEMMQRAGIFAKKAVESGADRLVWVGIDKAALKEAEVSRAKIQLSLVYKRLKKELKGRAFFLRLRSDSFSVFIRHKDLRNLRVLLDKPDFRRELLYKQEIFFGDCYPTGLEMLGTILQL